MNNLALSLQKTLPVSHFENPVSAFCITLYNERLTLLKKTLLSIIEGLAFHEAATKRGEVACLCVMIDGGDVADTETLAWLSRHGMTTNCLEMALEGESLHMSSHSVQDLCRHLGVVETFDTDVEQAVRMIVCVKAVNRGKLHSHALFFRGLCGWLRPSFCFQIDAGTVIARPAYANLMKRMRDEPSIGALAPCIMTPDPDNAAIFLSTWQYMDFILQKSLYWPFEVAAGHLSVVPGQFCVFRWAALQPRGGDVEGVEDPVEGYLRGLATTKPLEKVMYLAEDRVIGNEIVLRRDSDWRLEYAPEAQATTDACVSIGELKRQRRRWNNSALACRIWLLGKLPGVLAQPDRTWLAKARFANAMLCQFMLLLFEFGAPAISVATISVFFSVFQSASSAEGQMAKLALCVSLAGILGMSWGLRPPLEKRSLRWFVGVRGALNVIAALAMGFIFFQTLPRASMVLMLTPGLLIFAAIALVNWRSLLKIALLHNVYVIANLVLSPWLAAYSMLNMHDVSWGTKGLTESHTHGRMKARMSRLRWGFVAGWVAVNAALTAMIWRLPGMTSDKLNILFEVTCLVGTATAAIAVLNLCWRRVAGLFSRSRKFDFIAPTVLEGAGGDV